MMFAFNINIMKNQQEYDSRSNSSNKLANKESSIAPNNWRLKQAFKQHRKQLQKRLFGDHYNYSKVGLNKEKKHLLQQQKNTEIERQNLILLQKLQRIVKRPTLINTKRRLITEIPEENSLQKEIKYHSPIEDRDNENISKNSNKQHTKYYMSSEYKSKKMSKRIIFNGQKELDSKVYQITSYIEQGKCNISIKSQDVSQKIKVDIETYKQLYRNQLQKNHSKIIDILTFNGKIFKLAQLQNVETKIEEQNNLNLPLIYKKGIDNQKSFRSKPI